MELYFILVVIVAAQWNYEYLFQKLPRVEAAHFKVSMDFEGSVRKAFAMEIGLHAGGGNMVCSPLSALVPLAKLLIGVPRRSHTEKELLNAMGISGRCELKGYFKNLINRLEYLKGGEFSLASRIYISTKKKLKRSFRKKAEGIFKFSVEMIDTSRPDETAQTINRWVYEHTKEKISTVVSRDDITANSSTIVVNAAYFCGNWKYPFGDSFPDDFHAPDRTIRTQMMNVTEKFNYYKSRELNAQIVELPYRGLKSSMIIILPNESHGLPILLRTLIMPLGLLNQAFHRLREYFVEVTIPKFTIETTINLKRYYQKMGIKNVLSRRSSEVSRIVKNENLYITNAIQKAYIKVNERGTLPAEATAPHLQQVINIVGMPVFKADHPFLFFVKAYNDQLFAGVVNAPEYN